MSQLRVVLSRLDGVRKSANGFSARCPAESHGGDHNPSLSVGEGENGRILLSCHKGCAYDDIIAGINFTSRDLAGDGPPTAEWTPYGEAVAVYPYTDERGTLLFQVLRTADKQFPQRVPDPLKASGWTWRLGETRRVLYRLPQVIRAVGAGQPILIVEGEADVEAAERIGAVATCNPGGAGKWRAEYAGIFRDAEVTIVADRDIPGGNHAREIYGSLTGVARSVRVVEPATGKDLADHLAAGMTLGQLVQITSDDADDTPDLAPDIYALLAMADAPYDWLVPDLIERGDRLVITGSEGVGKSVLVRQLAASMAAGLHPFSFARHEPLQVLVVDCENSLRQTRRFLRRLDTAAQAHGASIPKGNLRFIFRPEGINLLGEDLPWLIERVILHKPDVLFIGPLYRLHAANLNEELPARKIVAALDAARLQGNCALVLEAHAGHGEASASSRPIRPTGSSLFLRWPEFGYGIRVPKGEDPGVARVVDVVPWRGPRDERFWPAQLRRGAANGWPWVEETPSSGGWPIPQQPVGSF